MQKRTRLSACIAAAICGGLLSQGLQAQQANARVEVTGSSIKRIDGEGSLPVFVVTRQDIERSGVTSAVELIQNLPVVQGGTVESASIGGGGGGIATVSLHNLGSARTLVLLNGKRLLGEFGGSVDLNMLPLAIIERVEVLTDGASAIYGSDAIAGVVNFITKRNWDEGSFSMSVNRPTKPGADEHSVSLAKGFGNLARDGYNAFFSLSADKREALVASQRDFSKTGVIRFPFEGGRAEWFNGSASAIPGNVVVGGVAKSPYLAMNGKCPPMHVQDGATCYFDYASTVQAFPDRERTNLYGSFTKQLNAGTTLSLNALLGKTSTSGKIAPAPGGILVDPAGPFGDYLKAVGYSLSTPATVRYRAFDLGNRTSFYDRENKAIWATLEGSMAGWDYTGSIGWQSAYAEESNSGYPYGIAFSNLLRSGLFNPFVLPGNQSQAALDAASKIMVSGVYSADQSYLRTYDFRATRDVGKLAGGPLSISVGLNRVEDKAASMPSLTAQGMGGPQGNDTRFGDASASIPYAAKRVSNGIFAEAVAAVSKELELSGAIRYDDYESIGGKLNSKASFRFTPRRDVLIRGSIGTGFRAPTLSQLYMPVQSFGVTGKPYECTAEMAKMAASLGATCQPGKLQYDIFNGGNSKLAPEESRQASLGIRLEPNQSISYGADLWWVAIRKTFGSVVEEEAFGNVYKYPDLWMVYNDPVTGDKFLAYNSATTNLGNSYTSGIDFDVIARNRLASGNLTSSLRATYMIRDDFQLLPNGEYYATIADNHPSIGAVTFRWRGQLRNTYQQGNWAHTVNFNFQSGYRDYPAFVYGLDGSGNYDGNDREIRLKAKAYYTVDLQTAYRLNKSTVMSFGIRNLFDRDPPLSLRSSGAHMLGFDYRYYNPIGRTGQLRLSVSF